MDFCAGDRLLTGGLLIAFRGLLHFFRQLAGLLAGDVLVPLLPFQVGLFGLPEQPSGQLSEPAGLALHLIQSLLLRVGRLGLFLPIEPVGCVAHVPGGPVEIVPRRLLPRLA